MLRIPQIFAVLSPRERKAFLSASILALISVITLGVYFIHRGTVVVPAEGGTYTEGIVGQPTYVNPVLASSPVDKSLVRLLFANVPAIAEKIEVAENGRVVKVRIKDGLVWSDGGELTSDDVIFTVQEIQKPETGSPYFSNWQGVSATRGSRLEVLFNLATPYAFFKENLEGLYVIPKHLFAEVPSANWRLSDYNLKPVGSGPYEFLNYEKRADGFITNYRLRKNLNYSADHALIEYFELQFFTNDKDLIASFNGGQIDGFANLDPKVLEQIMRPHEKVSFGSPTSYAVFWNQSQNLALQSPEIREALARAVNRDELIQRILKGNAVANVGPIPPTLGDFALASGTPQYSLDAAKELLEKNGWVLNSEGVREKTLKKSKITFALELTVPDIPFLVETAQTLRDSWKQIGADVKLVTLSPREALDSAAKNRNYQAILFGNTVQKSGDLFSFWHSSERFYPGLNLALYNNRKADQLIESIRQNLDFEKRKAEFQEIQRIILEDDPAVFLFSPSYLYITGKNVGGIRPEFVEDIADRFRNVNGWHIETARVIKGND